MASFNPKKGEFLRKILEFIFGFENKRGEILLHWVSFAENFSHPPKDFYDAIEKEIDDRQFPHLNRSRLEFAEGGFLSDKRLYLRLFRERFALYACASPLGTGYFFSCRTVYIPALVRLWHLLALFAFFGVIGGILFYFLGFTFAIIALVTLLFALAATFRNATASVVADLDTFLLRIPVISTIYENWFREDTYYRVDTRTVYLQWLPELIRELAEEITAAKGVKLIEHQYTPILGEIYKAVESNKQTKPERK